MNDPGDTAPAPNPFSTRYVRPGAVPFLFPPGLSAAALADRLRGSGWRGQIVGPHGSGKSALLAALVPAIEAAGRGVCPIELHDGQRRLPPGFPPQGNPPEPAVVIVDGYEQLSRFSRFRLRRVCARLGLGLLVTTHRPVRLPELFRTRPDLALAQRIVDRLLAQDRSLVTPEEVADRFSARQGDLREMLFDLYDVYERRRRNTNTNTGSGLDI